MYVKARKQHTQVVHTVFRAAIPRQKDKTHHGKATNYLGKISMCATPDLHGTKSGNSHFLDLLPSIQQIANLSSRK